MKTRTSFKDAVVKAGWTPYIYIDESDIPAKQEGEVTIFHLGKYVTAAELEQEYASRGMVPADPFSLLELDFLESHVATQWKDKNGAYFYATFDRWDGERYVYVNRSDGGWVDGWSFGGVCRPSVLESKPSLDTEPLELPLNLVERIAELEAFKDRLVELIPSLGSLGEE